MMLDEAGIAVLRRKVAWRIVPLVVLLYFIAYLDRANVGFAKLRMAEDLNFSEAVFGLGIGIFFIGYLTLEIPGALLVEHWSARKWFARIPELPERTFNRVDDGVMPAGKTIQVGGGRGRRLAWEDSLNHLRAGGDSNLGDRPGQTVR